MVGNAGDVVSGGKAALYLGVVASLHRRGVGTGAGERRR